MFQHRRVQVHALAVLVVGASALLLPSKARAEESGNCYVCSGDTECDSNDDKAAECTEYCGDNYTTAWGCYHNSLQLYLAGCDPDSDNSAWLCGA